MIVDIFRGSSSELGLSPAALLASHYFGPRGPGHAPQAVKQEDPSFGRATV